MVQRFYILTHIDFFSYFRKPIGFNWLILIETNEMETIITKETIIQGRHHHPLYSDLFLSFSLTHLLQSTKFNKNQMKNSIFSRS